MREMKKTPKMVVRLLVRACEQVFVPEEVEKQLSELAELCEEAFMSLEIESQERPWKMTPRDETDLDWFDELTSEFEVELDRRRKQREETEKLAEYKLYENVVGL